MLTYSVQQPLSLRSATLLLQQSHKPSRPRTHIMRCFSAWNDGPRLVFLACPICAFTCFHSNRTFILLYVRVTALLPVIRTGRTSSLKRKKKKAGPIIAFSPAWFWRRGLCFWSIQLHFSLTLRDYILWTFLLISKVIMNWSWCIYVDGV